MPHLCASSESIVDLSHLVSGDRLSTLLEVFSIECLQWLAALLFYFAVEVNLSLNLLELKDLVDQITYAVVLPCYSVKRTLLQAKRILELVLYGFLLLELSV